MQCRKRRNKKVNWSLDRLEPLVRNPWVPDLGTGMYDRVTLVPKSGQSMNRGKKNDCKSTHIADPKQEKPDGKKCKNVEVQNKFSPRSHPLNTSKDGVPPPLQPSFWNPDSCLLHHVVTESFASPIDSKRIPFKCPSVLRRDKSLTEQDLNCRMDVE
ncbi:hypothetical protein M513_04320 [Trichuris suis]|uniref:Uncharacterized protein n=1 Tax=Trichuris suis TaxID=68888 RepID=A0A085MCE0_9BILA|nr:hypothetical protein M513_04320 [Trichuris suis]